MEAFYEPSKRTEIDSTGKGGNGDKRERWRRRTEDGKVKRGRN